MSQFKNNPNIYLYYTDTDSIFINGKLNEDFISNDIGDFKLEYEFKDITFLGPKIYSGVTLTGETITKIKGYKDANSVSFEDMKSLLIENSSLPLNHKKWFKNLKC